MKLTVLATRIVGCVFAVLALSAHAQKYPNKPINFIVPYPPGGIADTYARALGQRLSDRLGQPVIMDNKPGGSLIVGTQAAAKAAPDGYTLLLASVSSLAINTSAFKTLPYDPVKDFAPVSLAFYTPLYLMVNPNLPVKSVKDLVALAKSQPGKMSFASLGHGTSLHLAGEMFKNLAGIDLLHVPFKGTTTALPDLLEGRVDMIFDGGAFLPHAAAGKLRLLGVTSPVRASALPQVATMAESGVPGYDLVIWFGVVAPAGTPRAIVDRLTAEINEIAKEPGYKERLTSSGAEPIGTTPEAFSQLIAKDTPKWGKLLRDAGIQPR
ncbi:Bug family tripartite tricarboxylate transporter substrate binding protein [Lacisediminimonas profundi]|uniref:Bug family tripartite tricarboxylate transporter substrate binding protein n=1 Tax=Lacisediminimonas profundi TaxID=2603856 RepID=UPI00124B3FE4|nr:tripartite tricarboxylate transporter substrate binding protein [Lacisediminimonas profundi]